MEIISFFAVLLLGLIEKTSYFGIFLLMTLESLLIPIPSEITMPFAGFLASSGKLSFIAVVFVGAFANLAGSILAYYLGFIGEEPVVRKMIRGYGKYILVSERDFNKSITWFKKYGSSIVFFSRLIPVVRTYISLPAGISKMNFKKFCILTFLGSLIWSFILAYAGFILGANWDFLGPYFRKFDYIILLGILMSVVYLILRRKSKLNSN